MSAYSQGSMTVLVLWRRGQQSRAADADKKNGRRVAAADYKTAKRRCQPLNRRRTAVPETVSS